VANQSGFLLISSGFFVNQDHGSGGNALFPAGEAQFFFGV
jgi:hypothetical protein